MACGMASLIWMTTIASGCGGCDKTNAVNVSATSDQNCLVAMAGTQGDTCNVTPTVTVDNNCAMDWVRTSGIIAKAGQKGRTLQLADAQMSGDLYTVIGTIGSKQATVSWQVKAAPK